MKEERLVWFGQQERRRRHQQKKHGLLFTPFSDRDRAVVHHTARNTGERVGATRVEPTRLCKKGVELVHIFTGSRDVKLAGRPVVRTSAIGMKHNVHPDQIKLRSSATRNSSPYTVTGVVNGRSNEPEGGGSEESAEYRC